jgi:hypothetical protein
MPDPFSWKVVEPGWEVVAGDGSEIGRVDEVVGDLDADIFTGLKILTGLLGKAKYVPSELVGQIVEGRVTLTLSKEDAANLRDWEDVAPSA